jgi:hypothetical protein
MAKKQNTKAANVDAKLVDAPASEALAALQSAGDKAGALLEAWTSKPNVEALDAVAASDSPHRKAARRALAVLKSRGVNVPERKVAPVAGTPAQLQWEAWFLPPDPAGVSMITIGSHSTGERWSVVDVRIHEVAGLIEVSPGEATGSSIREAFKRTKEGRGMAPTPVPVPWARWRVADARKKNPKTGLVMPMGYDSAAPMLEPVPDQEPESPIKEVVAEERDIEPRAKVSGTLHNEPEFRGWMPDPQTMQQMLGKVGEKLGTDPSQVPPEKVNELFDQEMAAATDRFFTPDVRQVIADRMRDCAISVLARVGKERAIDVIATAEACKRAGLITSPPSDIPFLKAFFQKGLAVMASNTGGKISIPVPQPAPEPVAPVGPRITLP